MATPFQNFGAFRAAAATQARAASETVKTEARRNFDTARDAWRDAGGAKAVKEGVTGWAKDMAGQYRQIHSNKGDWRSRIHDDSTKATFRSAAGMTLNNFLKQKAQKAAKKGGILSQTFWNFAHTAFQGTMRSLKDDQRIFTNIAKVRRGDPDVGQLTHTELREVMTHAQKYGGKDNEAIHASAHNELDRRQTQKAQEHAKYDARRREELELRRAPAVQAKAAEKEMRGKTRAAENLHKQEQYHQDQLRRNEELHKQKLKHQTELRQVAGHGAAAKAATDAAVKQAGARKVAKDKPAKSKEALQVVGKTRKGNAIVKTKSGNTRVATQEEVAKSRGTRSRGVTPTRRTRR